VDRSVLTEIDVINKPYTTYVENWIAPENCPVPFFSCILPAGNIRYDLISFYDTGFAESNKEKISTGDRSESVKISRMARSLGFPDHSRSVPAFEYFSLMLWRKLVTMQQ